MSLLEIDGVCKAFGETKALTNCRFSCVAGSVHVLLGENGSGKSTAVKIIAGIVSPDAGALRIGGSEVSRFSPRRASELGVAAVLQEVMVIESLTVLDNLFLGYDRLLQRRISKSMRRVAARRMLEPLSPELAAKLDAPVASLPLSAQQVVAIGRGLLRNPRILILDEATSALDVTTRSALFGVVRRLTGQGHAVLFISHRMDEVLELGEVITVLRGGETVATVARGDADIESLFKLMASKPREESALPDDAAVADPQ